jgi:hypothetical protein
MSKKRAIREVDNGVNSHQFLYQSLGETWQETGEKQKASQKLICKALIIKWAQLGSNQRPPDYECSFFDILFISKNRNI